MASTSSIFTHQKSTGLRLWHVLSALVVVAQLLTVIMHDRFFENRDNAALIERIGQENGAPVEHAVAKKIAHEMTDRFWNWHVWLGYVLGGLILLRFFIAWKNGEALWHSRRLIASRITAGGGEVRHYLLVRALYFTFYISVLFMVISGLIMRFEDSLNWGKDFMHLLHETHEIFQWYFFAFCALHIAGVLRAEFGPHRGVVQTMIR